MRKKLQSVIRQTVKQSLLGYLWTVALWAACVAFGVYVLANIIVSQSPNPLYYRLFSYDRNAMVKFLQQIRLLPEFHAFFSIAKNMYGNSITNDVFASRVRREALIKEYESLLVKTPKSRDLLYNLSILYRAQGDEEKADYYLEEAKKIDPTLQ